MGIPIIPPPQCVICKRAIAVLKNNVEGKPVCFKCFFDLVTGEMTISELEAALTSGATSSTKFLVAIKKGGYVPPDPIEP